MLNRDFCRVNVDIRGPESYKWIGEHTDITMITDVHCNGCNEDLGWQYVRNFIHLVISSYIPFQVLFNNID